WKDRWQKNDWSSPGYKNFIKDRHMKKKFSRAGKDMLQMLINQVEGKATAWAIRCDYNRFINGDTLTLYPCISKIYHIGNDGRGTNTPKDNKLNVILSNGSIKTILKPFEREDNDITQAFYEFYKSNAKSDLIIFLRRIGLYNLIKG